MPRFHFHIRDGVSLPDAIGTELPDWTAARLEAVRRAGSLLQGEAQRVAEDQEWRIEVTDHAGLILFSMAFLIIDSPIVTLQTRSAT